MKRFLTASLIVGLLVLLSAAAVGAGNTETCAVFAPGSTSEGVPARSYCLVEPENSRTLPARVTLRSAVISRNMWRPSQEIVCKQPHQVSRSGLH